MKDTLKTTKDIHGHEPPVTSNVVDCKLQETNTIVDGSITLWYHLEPDEDIDTEYQWNEEDLKVLKQQIESEEKAKCLYGGYTDMDPCFPQIYVT